MEGNQLQAAAAHVLESSTLQLGLLPDVVSRSGDTVQVDWDTIDTKAELLSAGEVVLVAAAQVLAGRYNDLQFATVLERLDPDHLARVGEALLILAVGAGSLTSVVIDALAPIEQALRDKADEAEAGAIAQGIPDRHQSYNAGVYNGRINALREAAELVEHVRTNNRAAQAAAAKASE